MLKGRPRHALSSNLLCGILDHRDAGGLLYVAGQVYEFGGL